MKFFLKKNSPLLLILLMAFFGRFAGISWGLPYPFHPDEWNMASAVTQLSWSDKLNPHFFAYGQLPLYLAYFCASFYNRLLFWTNFTKIETNEAIFFLRFWSAITSVGTVYLVYLIAKRWLNSSSSLVAALLAVFTPGLIQIAHFGTTESLLSFFFLASAYFSLMILEKPNWKNYLATAVFLGLALGTKISALVFCISPFLATVFTVLKQKPIKEKLKTLALFLLSLILTLALALAVSPYLLLDFSETKRILFYETQVATGQIPVFYTRQFVKTTPAWFQLQKIFPYVLGWPIFILGVVGWLISVILILRAIRKRKILKSEWQLLTLDWAFLAYFLSQAFLFCKWTRFMAPLFAFFPIFAAFFLSRLSHLRIKAFLLGIALLPGIIFSSLYFRPDIRFQASEWIYQNIPSGSRVLSETGNMIELPILPPSYPNYRQLTNDYSLSPVSFDFYRLDEDSEVLPQLLSQLENSDYIFVPSRRLFVNHLRLPEKYPLTAKYYKLLFSGQLGFAEIKKFQALPDEEAEETWSVFDHPVIRIFQKKVSFTHQQYEKLFQEN